MLTNMLGGLGVVANTPLDQLQDTLASRGYFSASFVLAYVFVVPSRPHDLPLGGTMPTSTQIFLIGLINLIASTLWSYTLWLVLRRWMRDRQVHGKWWHSFVFPRTWSKKNSNTVKPVDDAHTVKTVVSGAPEEVAPSDAAEEDEVRLNARHALLGIIDLVAWTSVNLACLVTGLVLLTVGRYAAHAQIDEYVAGLSSGKAFVSFKGFLYTFNLLTPKRLK